MSERKQNKYLNTPNYLGAVLLTGAIVEYLALTKPSWGGSISKNISKGLKVAGPIGVAAAAFLFGHWIDDADPKD